MIPGPGFEGFFILLLERQLDPENIFDKPKTFMFKNGAKRTYTVTSFK